jgi:predicted negative regulator of RcsB-dependent stress response
MWRFVQWARRNLVWLVIIGALLDVGVFGFQVAQFNQIQTNSIKNDCWSRVLDGIVSHKPPAITHGDIVKAQACEKLP